MEGMARQADTVLAEALELSADERIMVASSLLASLDSDVIDETELDRRWSAEIDRRAALLESGEARTFSRDEVLAGLAELRAARTG
jgi:putative addiction module component (TIGR02574 family)